MFKTKSGWFAITGLLLGACAAPLPNAPSVMVLPGDDKDFGQFRADNEVCKQFAAEQAGGAGPDRVAAESGARSAAAGTLVGAAAGAAINGGRGAATGAGAGLAVGALSGIGAGDNAAARLQRRYDIGYQQCMYAKGHRLPHSRGIIGDFFHGTRGQRPARSDGPVR